MPNKLIPSHPGPLPPPPPRNSYECSDDLATLLTNLRDSQKAFFKAKPGTSDRNTALQNSKYFEKELDKFLQERKAPVSAPDLFNS